MKERYIAPAVMLIAGAITSILNIIDEIPVLDGLIRLLVVLIIFYILGKIVTVIIRKATRPRIEKEETVENIESESISAESLSSKNLAAEEQVITRDQ
ncbi:MAG: hypothetical protein ACK5JH_05250 [Anaerocolumna sp.]